MTLSGKGATFNKVQSSPRMGRSRKVFSFCYTINDLLWQPLKFKIYYFDLFYSYDEIWRIGCIVFSLDFSKNICNY